MSASAEQSLRDAYIDLVKRTITNYAYLGGGTPFDQFRCVTHYQVGQGEWKIDPKASKTAPFPPPQTQTLSVVHRDPELSVAQRTATGLPRGYKYKTNGEPTENVSPHDVKLVSKANWSGAELTIRTGSSSGAHSAAMEDRWALSKGGQTLTVIRQGKMVYVYRKQP